MHNLFTLNKSDYEMSDWKESFNQEISAFKALKKMFEAGAVDKLYDIKDIHSGKVADALGINKGRYASKLAHPETFSAFEILRFSYVINIDPNIIINIIQEDKEVLKKIHTRVKRNVVKIATKKPAKKAGLKK